MKYCRPFLQHSSTVHSHPCTSNSSAPTSGCSARCISSRRAVRGCRLGIAGVRLVGDTGLRIRSVGDLAVSEARVQAHPSNTICPPTCGAGLTRRGRSAGPLAPLSELRPWAALMVAPTLCQRVVEGVEPRMLSEAAAQAKPYRYLETADEVAASLESIPLAAVSTGLELLLADLTEPQRTLERMQEAWLRRDPQAVYRIAAESPMFSLPGIRSAHPRRTQSRVGAARVARWAAGTDAGGGRGASSGGPRNLIECLGHPVEPVSLGS